MTQIPWDSYLFATVCMIDDDDAGFDRDGAHVDLFTNFGD